MALKKLEFTPESGRPLLLTPMPLAISVAVKVKQESFFLP